MIHKTHITCFLVFTVLLVTPGCITTSKKTEKLTRGEVYTQIYSEKPRTVAVLPPINSSTLPEATEYYMTTIEKPLTLAGYDVLPEDTVTKTIQEKNLQDTEALYALPPETLHDYFDTDMVLYSRIKQWDMATTGLISRLIISVDSEIVSTKTSQQLWRYNSSLNIDLNTVKSIGGSVHALLEEMLTDADEATVIAMSYALRLNSKLVRDLPYGPTHKQYLQDQETKMIGTIPEKSILAQ